MASGTSARTRRCGRCTRICIYRVEVDHCCSYGVAMRPIEQQVTEAILVSVYALQTEVSNCTPPDVDLESCLHRGAFAVG